MINKIEHKGKVYFTVDDPDNKNCNGCAFNNDAKMCGESNDLTRCFTNKIIWVERKEESKKITENKYTVEEVLQCYLGYSSKDSNYLVESIKEVKAKLELKNDPEYIKYLELKEKYEMD